MLRACRAVPEPRAPARQVQRAQAWARAAQASRAAVPASTRAGQSRPLVRAALALLAAARAAAAPVVAAQQAAARAAAAPVVAARQARPRSRRLRPFGTRPRKYPFRSRRRATQWREISPMARSRRSVWT